MTNNRTAISRIDAGIGVLLSIKSKLEQGLDLVDALDELNDDYPLIALDPASDFILAMPDHLD